MSGPAENPRSKIRELRRVSADGRCFISPYELRALLSRASIADVIRDPSCWIPSHLQPATIDRIFQKGKIVFSILIWRGWQNNLLAFIEHDALDSKLPLDLERAKKIPVPFREEFATSTQWEFLPPTLTREMRSYHYYFRDEEILPFVGQQEIGKGAFGVVFKMSVPHSCQTIFPDHAGMVSIVRKRLKIPKEHNEGYWKREKECLMVLDHLHHPNIVPLLGSYSQHGFHNFLFPLFDMALGDFLDLEERLDGFEDDFTLFRALEGLSSAVEMVHSLSFNAQDHDFELERIGYHHDIRPANILIGGRTFYLADFGLARVKPAEAGSGTEWKYGLGDYIGPECMDQNLRRKEVGRPLDIWSLGCMILEIATYFQAGRGGLIRFREVRWGSAFLPNMQDRYFFAQNELKPSVTAWISQLQAQPKNGLFRQLLQLVTSMLRIEPTQRPKAKEVHQELSYLAIKALFEASMQSFTELREEFSKTEENWAQTVAIKLVYQRLSAWGKVLHFGQEEVPSEDAVRIVSVRMDLVNTLTNLRESIKARMPKSTRTEGRLPISDGFRFSKPIHELLQEIVEDLCIALPPAYQGKLKHIWSQDSVAEGGCVPYDGSSLSPLSETRQYSDLVALASVKLENLRQQLVKLVDFDTSQDGSMVLDPKQLEYIKESPHDQSSGIGLYDGTQVLVEWAFDSEEWESLPELRKRRIKVLADFLRHQRKPCGFRVLDCLGFVPPTLNVPRCGFVYSFPAPLPPDINPCGERSPISFYHLLSSRSKRDIPLGSKYKFAYNLANCVRVLHIAGWVHKNISSKNVLFFDGKNAAKPIRDLLQCPYLVNFHDSRPSSGEWDTQQPRTMLPPTLKYTTHPDYADNDRPFKDIYDYYSIGVILLELGSWATIDTVLSKVRERDIMDFREELIAKYVPRLAYAMGETYQAVTLACLKSSFGQADSHLPEKTSEKSALTEFYNKVVGPLAELAASPI